MRQARQVFLEGVQQRPSQSSGRENISIRRLSNGPAEHSLTSTSHWHFLFIDNGSGSTVFDRTRSPLEAGNILWVPPATVCQFSLTPEATAILIGIDEMVLRTLVLPALPGNQDRTSSFWRSYYTARILAHSTGVENRQMRLQTGSELSALAQHLGKGGDPAIVGTALVILMSPLKRPAAPGTKTSKSQADVVTNSNIVIEFRVLIEEYFTRHLKIGEYADMLGITPKMLLRACHDMTGRKAVALIHDRIVLEATRHLRYSNRSISDIAYALGFDDVGYFSRFIKQHAGHSPSELRNQE